MPNSIIKSFAKKAGKSEKEVEKLWDKAKELATKEYPRIEPESERCYKIVTGMLKKMLNLYGVNENTDASAIGDTAGVSTVMGKKCFDVTDDCFWHLHNNKKEPNKWYSKFYKDMQVADHAKANPKGSFYIKHKDLGMIRKIKL